MSGPQGRHGHQRAQIMLPLYLWDSALPHAVIRHHTGAPALPALILKAGDAELTPA